VVKQMHLPRLIDSADELPARCARKNAAHVARR